VNGHGAQSIKGEEQTVQVMCAEGNEADRVTKCSRTVISLVSHC
jgi:hypothetical protein